MSQIRISICIPTKNFGRFLGDTLQSVIDQKVDGLEIVIVDGGSTDNTTAVVEKFQNQFSALRYLRQEKAMGVDADLRTAVKNAQGDYCWLMSADDVLKPGAIARVLAEMARGCDTYLCNRTECDISLRPVRDKLWLDKKNGDQVVDFSDRKQILKYFSDSRSLGALFSYISSIVFLRKKWLNICIDADVEGTNYAHVFTLFSILLRGGTHMYIKESLVLCRGGNDSFHANGSAGLVRRFLIDIDGYSVLGEKLFQDDKTRREFNRVIRHERPWFTWTRIAIRIREPATWEHIREKLQRLGYTKNQMLIVSYFGLIERYVPVFALVRRIRLLCNQ